MAAPSAMKYEYDASMQQVDFDVLQDLKQQKHSVKKMCFSCNHSPSTKFVFAGCLLLFMLSIVPLWNAASLLQDFNYVFWAGRAVPHWIMWGSLCIVPFFAITGTIFFWRANASVLTEQTIMMVATTFITLFGLFLMIISLSLTQQAEVTSTNLLYNCEYSEQTHRLYEYSQVLQNIRATPACKSKFSVEECLGYQEAAPYTDFLKNMENSYKCVGFCYRGKTASPLTSLVATDEQERHFVAESIETRGGAGNAYPPTLFSDANYQADCENMSARVMKCLAGDIGSATFYQGVYLVLISVATGFLKLFGKCINNHEPQSAKFSA